MIKNTCIAYEFLALSKIKKVYAWTDQIAYSFGYNISFNGKYMEYHISNGIIVSTEVKSSTYVYTRWAHKLLQFRMK